jgi:heptose I phosphotransferase
MVPIACASKDGNSCILTLGIRNYKRASELFAELAGKDRIRRRRLIGKIAELARGMHSAGMAHQDFYLVHLFVKEGDADEVHIIDLQRVVFRQDFSERWRVKDLAQLLFSSEKSASMADMMYFWKIYAGMPGVKLLRDKSLIKKVMRKAASIRRHAG